MIEPNEFYLRLGESIRRRREQLQLTQAELGESLGLSRTSVTNIERGRQRLLIDQFNLVCKTLNLSPQALLTETEGPTMGFVVPGDSQLRSMPTVSAYVKKTLVKTEKP